MQKVSPELSLFSRDIMETKITNLQKCKKMVHFVCIIFDFKLQTKLRKMDYKDVKAYKYVRLNLNIRDTHVEEISNNMIRELTILKQKNTRLERQTMILKTEALKNAQTVVNSMTFMNSTKTNDQEQNSRLQLKSYHISNRMGNKKEKSVKDDIS